VSDAVHEFYAQVALPGGLLDSFTYRIPQDMDCPLGSLVLVPLGNRKEAVLGLVIDIHQNKPSFLLKDLALPPYPYCLSSRDLEIIHWCSKFYCTPLACALDVFWPKDFRDIICGKATKSRPFLRKSIEKLTPPPLTASQEIAFKKLSPLMDQKGFRGALLHGVTGSGKTRVYLELVMHMLERGKRVLLLVPEISLTPQTHQQFQQYLTSEVLLYHSNLPAPQRRHTWNALLQGHAQFLIGTRSAILLPQMHWDLILIDEEHDSSYKQQDPSPRYHCREMAFHIAHHNGGMVLLGSATPSLESYHYAMQGHLLLIELRERARPVELPKVELVDLKKILKQDRDLQISPPLREALTDTITQGHQAIVLHNRRGYSTAKVCLDCGHTEECEQCQVPLVFHRKPLGLHCHYCGRIYSVQKKCSNCGSQKSEFSGGAIEKVEEEILAWIPGAKVIRMDKDTVQGIGSSEKILQAFRNGQYNILLGTQMVAKGHDFPNVQLVGVISADTGTSLPDFRTGERLFQLMTQVAGRAGRAIGGGKVILQTWNPTEVILGFALQHDFVSFVHHELAQRKELHYPPYRKLLAIEVQSRKPQELDTAITAIETYFSTQEECQVLGPADAFIARVKGIHRKQFLLKGSSAPKLRELANGISQLNLPKSIRIRLDMDPMNYL